MLRPLIALAISAWLPGCAPAAGPAPAGVAPRTASADPAATPAAPRAQAPLQASGRTAAARTPARDRPGIAVFPFTNGGSYGPAREDMTALEVGIQGMLLTELQQNQELRIVERGILRQTLEEQDLVTAGRVDASTAARVGRMVGARYAITGTFMDLYGNFRLDGRIVDVETGEILKTVSIDNQRRENLYRLLMELAEQITRGVDLPPLAQATREERRARNVPDDAVLLLSLAMDHEDNGREDEAIELYRQIVRRFPDYTEAREALRQIEEG
jgi:TolB-like protein